MSILLGQAMGDVAPATLSGENSSVRVSRRCAGYFPPNTSRASRGSIVTTLSSSPPAAFLLRATSRPLADAGASRADDLADFDIEDAAAETETHTGSPGRERTGTDPEQLARTRFVWTSESSTAWPSGSPTERVP